MPDPIVPESRIFRIGRECYVVYLGKERDDVRPFLRIGNTRDIPDEVHRVISTTVIADDHVGNPLLEILNVPKCRGLYLGDTGVVGTMKRFFKSFDLPTDEVTDYRKVKDGEKRHMVWFYSSGNIHLRYDDKVIFDLHKREKEDGHFVCLYERAKGEFLRNPLRYIKQDFGGNGVILADGNGFWFEGGDMLSFEAHPGFVAKLMAEGVDPDFISASAYDLTQEDMDSHDAAVFIGFVKRMRQRKKQLRVLTSQPELLRKLRLLFPARGEMPATLDIADVSGRKKATFKDSIVSRKDGTWMIHRAGMPEVAFNGISEKGVSVDIAGGTITCVGENDSFTASPPRGYPINFLGHENPEHQLLEKYVGFVHGHVKIHLGKDEEHLISLTEKALGIIKDDISSGKTSVSPLLKQTVQQVKDSARRCDPTPGGPSWFLFSNAAVAAEILRRNAGGDHPLAKCAEQIEGYLTGVLEKSGNPDPILPFFGDLYLEGSPCLLWRVAKRGFVPADIASAKDINDNIKNIASLNEAPWKKDEERLLSLIRSLDEGGEGPLSEEQLALLSKPEEEKKAEESSSKEKEASGDTGPASEDRTIERRESAEAHGGASIASPRGRKPSAKKGGGAWIWILIILLLLLIGGFFVWDLSGKAPWGGIFGGRDAVERIDGADRIDDGSDGGADGGSGEEDDGTDDSRALASGDDDGTELDSEEAALEDVDAGEEGSDSGGAVEVDPDDVPRTQEEVDIYLNVDGIVITEADIHLAANEIAVLNGFKDLDYRVFTGADPDWIYPGNELTMPDGEVYEIRRGDTIWFLAARRVRLAVSEDKMAYDEAVDVLENPASTDSDRSDAVSVLEMIAAESKAEAMRRMAEQKLP